MIANIAFPRYSRIGAGAINELPSLIDSLGLRRPLLVTDAYLTRTGAVDRLLTLLREAGITCRCLRPAPCQTRLLIRWIAVSRRCARISPTASSGSAAAVPWTRPKRWPSWLPRADPCASSRLPAATVARRCPSSPSPQPREVVRRQLNSLSSATATTTRRCCARACLFLPIAAIIDYELTLSMPARLTADTGVDALAHAVEAYVSRKANPISDAHVAVGDQPDLG